MADDKNDGHISRRRFVKNSGYVAGGVVGGGVLGSLLGINWNDGSDQTATPPANYNRALMFFKRRDDFETLSAATERIFPEDDNGPGAIELGVPYFIDHQLAGDYGQNQREFMQGPFLKGTEFQGSQTPLKRQEIFMRGIRSLDKKSNHDYDSDFVDLDGDKQDAILQKFEEDDIDLKDVQSLYFFDLLRDATISGAYADPLYDGNEDMQGWKMKAFPGSQMSYLDDIEKREFIEMEPKSLKDFL